MCRQNGKAPYPLPSNDSTAVNSLFTRFAALLFTDAASAFSNAPNGSAADVGRSKDGSLAAARSFAMLSDFWLTPPEGKSDSGIAQVLGTGGGGGGAEGLAEE